MYVLQFEITSTHDFIKISIIVLQHTSSYIFREHTIVHNSCLRFSACSRAAENSSIRKIPYEKKVSKRQEIHFSEEEKIPVVMNRNKWLSKIMRISKFTDRRVNARCYDFSPCSNFNRIKVNKGLDKSRVSGHHRA
jgi:hypothetical protein